MSSPQPPDGGQQGQPPGPGQQPPSNAPDAGADSTQMISSRMDPQQQQGAADSTQVVQPPSMPPQQQGGDSTQVVPPAMQPPQPMYEQPGLSNQNSTQVVPPAMQPPQPMYTQPGQQQPPGYPQAGTPSGGFPAPAPQPGYPAPAPQPGMPVPGMPPGMPGAFGQPVEWGTRAVAYLIDAVAPAAVTMILVVIGSGMMFSNPGLAFALIGIGYVFSIGFQLWNYCYRQGTTGQSLGKSVVKVKLISEEHGQVIGFGGAFLRLIVHVVDAAPCGIGFLAPLWDEKKQTWADKIMKTIVVPADGGMPGQPPAGPGGYPQQQPGPYGPPPQQQPGPYGQQPPPGYGQPPQQW